MINIITGKIDSGKTTYLKNLYDKSHKGDGFICMKYFEGNTHLGYDLLHLKSEKQKPFIRLKTNIDNNWHQIFEIGKYSFSEEGFYFACKIIADISDKPIFIDEIGPLEIIQKSGFYDLLEKQLDKEIYITVRGDLYTGFLKTFNITQNINKITIE